MGLRSRSEAMGALGSGVEETRSSERSMAHHPDTDPFLALDEGEQITVTRGRELYSPVQYNNFEVGPYTATTTVRKGETRVTAGARVLKDMQQLADIEFRLKSKAYLDNLGAAMADAKRSR